MMGAHHAACGAAAWLALTSRVHVDLTALTGGTVQSAGDLGLGLVPTPPAIAFIGAIVCAGAAILPDADHPEATIAHAFPPLSNAACAGIGAVSGGHRNGTHSIIGITVFTFLAWAASVWAIPVQGFGTIHAGSGLAALFLAAFAFKALKLIPDTMAKSPWLAGTGFGALVAVTGEQGPTWWFPAAVALGTVVHVLGDMLTTGGINLVWPFVPHPPKRITQIPVLAHVWMPNGRLAMPVLGDTGSWREWLFALPITAYTAIAAGTQLWALTGSAPTTAALTGPW